MATANLRDKGVSEMSAALKRRFNFETVGPIGDLDAETALVRGQARASVERRRTVPGGRRRTGGPGHCVPGPARGPVGGGLGGGAALDRDEHRGGRVRGRRARPRRGVLPRRPRRARTAARPSARRGPQGRPRRRRPAARLLGRTRPAPRRQGSATWRTLWDLRTVLEG
ncbi:hypothetical protein ACR6C2_45015 [Streptomyces sp. INA 01156]